MPLVRFNWVNSTSSILFNKPQLKRYDLMQHTNLVLHKHVMLVVYYFIGKIYRSCIILIQVFSWTCTRMSLKHCHWHVLWSVFANRNVSAKVREVENNRGNETIFYFKHLSIYSYTFACLPSNQYWLLATAGFVP